MKFYLSISTTKKIIKKKIHFNILIGKAISQSQLCFFCCGIAIIAKREINLFKIIFFNPLVNIAVSCKQSPLVWIKLNSDKSICNKPGIFTISNKCYMYFIGAIKCNTPRMQVTPSDSPTGHLDVSHSHHLDDYRV